MSTDAKLHDGLAGSAIPEWAADEIRRTWFTARSSGSEVEAFRLFERMTDRLGFGRTENNPSLVESPNAPSSASADWGPYKLHSDGWYRLDPDFVKDPPPEAQSALDSHFLELAQPNSGLSDGE